MDAQEATPVMPGVLFREIHKNSFLKKVLSDKRAGFPRRTEKVWTVFCVHDDTEAFIELYSDHKVALSHKPDWFVSLQNALHVSPSIVGQGDDFEFAITLPSQVVRLSASSWDSMLEWVDTIRNKLRELRVLAPKENVYSKMPEPRHVLLPTRDPTSPLPLPPVGPTGLLPGVESPRPSGSSTSMASDDLVNGILRSNGPTTRDLMVQTNIHSRNVSSDLCRSRVVNVTNSPGRMDVAESTTESSPGSGLVRLGAPSQRSESVSSPKLLSSRPSVQSSTNCDATNASDRRREKSILTPIPSGSSVVVINENSEPLLASRRPPAALPDIEATQSLESPSFSPEGGGRRLIRASSVPSSSNVTVIEVPPPINSASHYEHIFLPDPPPPADTRSNLERVSSSGLIPRVPAKSTRDPESRADNILSPLRGNDRNTPQASQEGEGPRNIGCPVTGHQKFSQHTSVVTVKPHETCIQVAPKGPPKQTAVVRISPPTNLLTVSQDPSLQSGISHSSQSMASDAPGPSREVGEIVPPIPAAFQPAPSGLEVRDIPLIGGHQRRRRRSSSSDAGPVMRGLAGADLIRVAPAEAPETIVDAPRRTLRETQVCQLRREMSHPGGVRLPLRRKDCVGAIALVDVSNAVWVAGWKQREHPMLYNALHIGDRVISVGDVPVRTAGDAQKLLRGVGGPTVELVVLRLPLGAVLALQRSRSGGDVGLAPDSNSAAEVTVVPGGAAARAGLPPKTGTMDGLSLTSWTLTEINGRPLNLFCKPSEINTRLNSVGKELSVLVQPSDFIKQLRKQLKATRGYKEYLLF